MEQIRFDDIEKLRGRVSDTFGAFGPEIEVTQDMINKFADLTGDHQWIHVDVERAKRESPFKTPIAHGFLTLSLLPHFMHEALQIKQGVRLGVNYGLNRVR